MNLELNLEERVLRNPNIRHFTQKPINIQDGGAVLEYLGGGANSGGCDRIELVCASRLYDYMDAEEFAYETGMRSIVEFKEYVENLNNSYKHLFTEDESFVMGVTKNYSYSRGTYDTVKAIINKVNKLQQRPSGMYSIFNRIYDNQWAYNNFKDRMFQLENKRAKAKQASGNMVNNISDLVQSQTQRFDTIIESTEQANQMTDNFKVMNCIDADIENRLIMNQHTSINLYTLVICEAKEMTIVNNSNDEICRMMVPKTYLYFKRPLWRALTTDSNWIQEYTGSTPGGYHPYINSYPFHSYEADDYSNMTNYGWGALCLSSYQDDVLNSLNKNDYMSFIMGLMNWNNIYNKDHTNPYASITQVMSSTRFPLVSEEEADIVKTSIGFNKVRCFNQKRRFHTYTEIDPDQRYRNSEIHRNVYPYVPYILSECDEKQCPLRKQCDSYQKIKLLEDSFYPEILEDIVGNLYLYEHSSEDDIAFDYQFFYTKLVSTSDIDSYLDKIVTDKYNNTYDYWGNKEQELTEQEIALAAMQNQIAQWEQQQAATGGVHE